VPPVWCVREKRGEKRREKKRGRKNYQNTVKKKKGLPKHCNAVPAAPVNEV